MCPLIFLLSLCLVSVLGFFLGRKRARVLSKNLSTPLSSLPKYYGLYVSFWIFFPGFLLLVVSYFANFSGWGGVWPFIIAGLLIFLGLFLALYRVKPSFQARDSVEAILKYILFCCACLAILLTGTIFLSLMTESFHFFQSVPFLDFLTGTTWKPRTTFGPNDPIGSFGVIPLFTGTLLITVIALILAIPVGIFIAIYLSEYASNQVRDALKPTIELLAGIPTIVYGFFAIVVIAPFLQVFGNFINGGISPESALGVGFVMGVMIIPFISSMTDDALRSVSQELRHNSYALGATSSETIKRVILPAAMPGIVTGILLAASRAIGETMLVVMAAGLTANFTLNPLASVTTITVQIVALLTGDQEFTSPKTLAAFALGLTLFLVTLMLNVVALKIVKRYRTKYGV